MTGSVVLDVIIGLVFIYLIYSLLVTLIAEIIATNLGLRARNLQSAISRMLKDENVNVFKSFRGNKNIDIVSKFYDHPEVKFLSANKFFSKPSSIKAESFAKTLFYLFKDNGQGLDTKSKVVDGINQLGLNSETKQYLLNLLEDAGSDLENFKKQIGDWYDNTMKQATEWYKRNLQVLLFFIGLMVAIIFNLNTIQIVEKLSVDKNARAQMVELAGAYIANNPNSIAMPAGLSDSANIEDYNQRMDSFLAIKKQLDTEIKKTQTILGGGSWLPDSLALKKYVPEKNESENLLPEYINKDILPDAAIMKAGTITYTKFTSGDKWLYLWRMIKANFFGYALTALALSMGAPFWFDLLNKFMKLRGTISEKANNSEKPNKQ